MQPQNRELPEKYRCYKKAFEVMDRTKRFFCDLFLEYRVCLKCIFMIYGIEHTRIYSDHDFYLEMLPRLLGEQWEQESTSKIYNFDQSCMGRVCWLCEQIFQKSYLDRLLKEVEEQTKTKGFDCYQKFKLNIRIPNILMLRYIILVRHVYHRYNKLNLSQEQLTIYYNLLVVPIDRQKIIQPKTVLKWVLASVLNNGTHMNSTAEDSPDNLIVSLEIQYTDTNAESALMSYFIGLLGLEKKKEKIKNRKQKIDLGYNTKKDNQQNYRCNAYNIGKIMKLKQNQFQSVLSQIQNIDNFWKIVIGKHPKEEITTTAITYKLTLFTKNVYLCGRYIKFSRYLSQTPWTVNGVKLTQGSLQQEIEDRIYPLFYPGRKKQQIEIKFHAGGREDIDVRMLKGGRPFVLQFVNPIKSIKAIKEEDIFAFMNQQKRAAIKEQFSKWGEQQKGKEQFHSWRIVKLFELLVNHQNQYVQVQDFQETTESYISVDLKAAEKQKIKHYLCYIHSIQELTEDDKKKLNSLKDIELEQLTPLRVLHRRTLMSRSKMIHCLAMQLVSKHSAVLQVWASAGTYIKEFVHGDLGRTTPNVGSLLGKEVDILQLDVGSLKEGEWVEGDQHLMKMQKFEWMDE